METNVANVAVSEVTTNEVTTDIVTVTNTEKYKVLVIDNRVRLYKGKDQVSYEECGSHAQAIELANKWQKEHDASATAYGPQLSAEKQRHRDFVAKTHAAEKVAKKAAKKEKKNKDQIAEEVAALQAQLAILGE